MCIENFSDKNDYFNEIDNGYLTIDEFLEYNRKVMENRNSENPISESEIWERIKKKRMVSR